MTLINFEDGKVEVGQKVVLKSANLKEMKVMTVTVADFENDKLVLSDDNGEQITVSPDAWCLVTPYAN